MLEVKNLSFNTGGQVILNGLTASFPNNKTIAIIGPSGCGKTTLLKLISGLLEPASGEILRQYKAGDVGFIFQDFCLLPWRTVEQNIELPLKNNKVLTACEKKQWVDQALSMIGLQYYGNKYPYELSGGMQQRVGLARALVMQPKLLLMDEPFSAVDGQTRELLVEEFRTLCAKLLMTRILVTHQIDDVLDLADELIILSEKPAEVIDSLNIRQLLSELSREGLKQRIWQVLRDHVRVSDRLDTRHG